MERTFDLLTELPEDFFTDDREDSPPQEREDFKEGYDKSGEENKTRVGMEHPSGRDSA